MWKELLESFLYAALEIFYPSLYAAVDCGKDPVFLNKELRIPGSGKGQKIVDLLADVPMREGGLTRLLLHVELQGDIRGEPFHTRMFKYACLITLRQAYPFTALAIRTTQRGVTEELNYETKCFESRIVYEYRTVFIDALDEEVLLQMSDNPLALAVVAAVRMIRAGKNERIRFDYGREMVRILKSRGYAPDVRIRLAQFIEGMTNLSAAGLMENFAKEIENLLEEEEVMPVTTPIVEKVLRRKSYEWGKAEGKAEGERSKAIETARKMIARSMAIDVISDLTGLSEEDVRNISE